MKVTSINGHDKGLVAELVELQHKAFPVHMQCADPEEYFTEALGDESNLNIVMQDRTGAVIGYLLGIPHSHVFAELRQWDPALRDDPERVYLDIIQVLPEYRGRNLAYFLFQKVCTEAEKRNFFKLSMHARTTTGLNQYLFRIFAEISFFRRLENWCGCGEPFDYLEATTTMRTQADTRQYHQAHSGKFE